MFAIKAVAPPGGCTVLVMSMPTIASPTARAQASQCSSGDGT